MVRIGNIVGEIFDDVKEAANEIVIHEHCTQARQSATSAYSDQTPQLIIPNAPRSSILTLCILDIS